jgi:osmotically-inducible protein OsmY
MFAGAVIALAGPATVLRLAAQTPTPTPDTTGRNIAGPGDYGLREGIVRLIRRDENLSKERFTVVMVNGGAVFSGPIKNCALEKKALTIAASTRGVINVTDEMTVPRGDVPDAELAKAVTSLLSDAAATLALNSLDVRVEDGVLTLQGTVMDLASRAQAEDIAGTVLGITRISNHLQPANAPSGADDPTLLTAVVAYLADFHNFGFPGEITVGVHQGIVTLKGKVAMYMARQQAALAASVVKGVARVDNRIKVDPTVPPRASLVQAEK